MIEKRINKKLKVILDLCVKYSNKKEISSLDIKKFKQNWSKIKEEILNDLKFINNETYINDKLTLIKNIDLNIILLENTD